MMTQPIVFTVELYPATSTRLLVPEAEVAFLIQNSVRFAIEKATSGTPPLVVVSSGAEPVPQPQTKGQT